MKEAEIRKTDEIKLLKMSKIALPAKKRKLMIAQKTQKNTSVNIYIIKRCLCVYLWRS